jgi:gamma-glutamyl hydrolase
MQKSGFVCLTFALLFASAFSQNLNLNPVIGIVTTPTESSYPFPSSVYSYIAASYVQFIESAGARVVPIPWDAYNMTDYLDILNGVLFTGGSADLVASDGELNDYGSALLNIVQYVFKANNNGTYYPLWGTCLGFEAISILVSLNNSILEPCVGGVNVSTNNFINPQYNSSRLLANVPSWLVQLMATGNISYFDHVSMVGADAPQYNPLFAGNLTAVTYSIDDAGTKFISSFESPKYPIYGTQFHQEKSPFEWRSDLYLAINHSYPAVLLEQYLANFYINETRKNFNQFNTYQNQWMLIYNYNTTFVEQSSFSEVYLFLNTNLTDIEL